MSLVFWMASYLMFRLVPDPLANNGEYHKVLFVCLFTLLFFVIDIGYRARLHFFLSLLVISFTNKSLCPSMASVTL